MNKLRLILGIILGKTIIYKAQIKYCGHIDVPKGALISNCSFIQVNNNEESTKPNPKPDLTTEDIMNTVKDISTEWING